jgi:L-alanine-DL-glutamate epimerase-like enolase superfamily enzyme
MKDGEVSVPEGPGLGVELDEAKLKKYSTGQPIVITH